MFDDHIYKMFVNEKGEREALFSSNMLPKTKLI